MCMFCRSVFVLLSFFIWPLCCLFFFDLQIMITSLWYHLQTLLFRLFDFPIFWPWPCLVKVIYIRNLHFYSKGNGLFSVKVRFSQWNLLSSQKEKKGQRSRLWSCPKYWPYICHHYNTATKIKHATTHNKKNGNDASTFLHQDGISP